MPATILKIYSVVILLVSILLISGCQGNRERKLDELTLENGSLKIQGRVHFSDQGSIYLISAASQVAFLASGEIELAVYTPVQRAYVSLSVNNQNVDKYLINGTDTLFIRKNLGAEPTLVKLIKDTEAITGDVVIERIEVENSYQKPEDEKTFIEFIGNSITSAMGADTTDLACGSGNWYDQHRASHSYASMSADSLNSDFVLNSISGHGIYRNWNDESIEEPTLPQVYDNLWLNRDSTTKYQPRRLPDLISICLGTNDLSRGDGIKPRLPFNEDKFIAAYVDFVQKLYERDPSVSIALLTSPMVGGTNGSVLKRCLQKIARQFEKHYTISVFEFSPIIPTGCTYHPLIAEQKEMTEQLIPFYRDLLSKER